MKRLGVVAVVCVGFIAGIAFVYSCGGGSSAEAVTDVTGIETRLDTISNQITSLHNSITGADIMTIKVFDNVSLSGGSTIFSEPISVAGYKEIYFMHPRSSVGIYAHPTASDVTPRIQLSDYGTMPAYSDTMVFEAWNSDGDVQNGFLVIKLVP